MTLSGELDYRIRYDVEHDLFHAQNVFNDEYIKPTFIEYVQKLEKENASLKDALEGYKQNAKWCDKCDKFADLKEEINKIAFARGNLEEENAELKERNRGLDTMLTGESLVSNERKEQLTKAKEIIKTLLSSKTDFDERRFALWAWKEEVNKAEQFLKDSEVEK